MEDWSESNEVPTTECQGTAASKDYIKPIPTEHPESV